MAGCKFSASTPKKRISFPTAQNFLILAINSTEKTNTMDDATLALAFWAKTITLMNCTFNSLIFYWKNKVLRTEGLKVLKSLKMCRRVES
jgi:hypothetical protein